MLTNKYRENNSEEEKHYLLTSGTYDVIRRRIVFVVIL